MTHRERHRIRVKIRAQPVGGKLMVTYYDRRNLNTVYCVWPEWLLDPVAETLDEWRKRAYDRGTGERS